MDGGRRSRTRHGQAGALMRSPGRWRRGRKRAVGRHRGGEGRTIFLNNCPHNPHPHAHQTRQHGAVACNELCVSLFSELRSHRLTRRLAARLGFLPLRCRQPFPPGSTTKRLRSLILLLCSPCLHNPRRFHHHHNHLPRSRLRRRQSPRRRRNPAHHRSRRPRLRPRRRGPAIWSAPTCTVRC